MSTALVSALCLVPSLTLLSLIALRDPKRLRSLPRRASTTRRSSAWTPRQRRIAAIVALSPSAVLIAAGAWPALLIWLGALLAGGWLWVNWLAPPGTPAK